MDATLLDTLLDLRSPLLDWFFVAASVVGIGNAIWFALGVAALFSPTRRMAAWRLLLAVGLTYAMVDLVVKPVARRERPTDVAPVLRDLGLAPSTYSFPSGHAAGAVAGALAAGRVFPAAGAAFWGLAAAIAVSRVYLGVHWPSDVIAGAVLGLAIGWFILGGQAAPAWPAPIRAAGPATDPPN